MDARCGRSGRFWDDPRDQALRGAAGRLFEIAVPAVARLYQSARLGLRAAGD